MRFFIEDALGRAILYVIVAVVVSLSISKSCHAFTPEPATPLLPAPSRGLIVALFSFERLDDPGLGLGDEQRVDPLPAPALDGQPALLALGVEGSDLFAAHELASVTQVRL